MSAEERAIKNAGLLAKGKEILRQKLSTPEGRAEILAALPPLQEGEDGWYWHDGGTRRHLKGGT